MSGLRNTNSGKSLSPYGTVRKKITNILPGTGAGEVIVYEQLQDTAIDFVEANANTFTAVQTFTFPNVYKGVTSITAFAGGGQGSATSLSGEYNEITTCATAGDSVSLGTPSLGAVKWVRNLGANAADVFGATGVSIDGGSANAAVRIQPGQTVMFKGLSATSWGSNNRASGSVSQATSITTGVTLNAIRGLITTQSATAAAGGASHTFTVTNSFVQADSNISVYIGNYSGTVSTNGAPFVISKNRTDGTFDIVIFNAHAANALSGTLVIGFEIKN